MTSGQYHQSLTNQKCWRPRTLGETGMVNHCLRRLAEESRDRERAARVWSLVADETVTAGSRVVSYVDGTLTVVVEDKFDLSELRRTRAKWQRLMQQRLGGLRYLQFEIQEPSRGGASFGGRENERTHANGSSDE
ncbi:MAG: DciA family protein [Phycisphaerae bacterium]